jgi:spore maturation protein CgeB
MNIVFLGLSITSSWGNGHATTYRGLVRELAARGHDVVFLERDLPWYADNRDLHRIPQAEVVLYRSMSELQRHHAGTVRNADAVIVGSYVPEGIAVGEWAVRTAAGVTAFYDIDTPVTLAKLERGTADYVSRELIPRYELYLSFTGGPTLQRIERELGSPRARPLYCSVDPQAYFPEPQPAKWHLGYLGTYSTDRQPALEKLLIEPAARWSEGKFIVAGPQYPKEIGWPENVDRVEHLPPRRQMLTRADMVAAGFSPSVRLFEAAACGTPIVSDVWPGLEAFFVPGREIFTARDADSILRLLRETPPDQAAKVGEAGRARVLAHHTAAHRAQELEQYLREAAGLAPTPAGEMKRRATPRLVDPAKERAFA